MVQDSRYQSATETADLIFAMIHKTSPLWFDEIPAEALEPIGADIENMRLFAGTNSRIDWAIEMIEMSLILAKFPPSPMPREENKMFRHTVKMRTALQAGYAKTFVQLGRRDGFHCATCLSSEADLQIDHVMPVSKGGMNNLDNLQLLCRKCNSEKSDKFEGGVEANRG